MRKERKVGNRGEKGIYHYLVAGLTGTVPYTGHITVLGRVFCHILPTTAMCGQCAAMYGNVPSAATRNVLPYSARVGLYGVGGMWWERVVVCKVSRGGPVTHINLLLQIFLTRKMGAISPPLGYFFLLFPTFLSLYNVLTLSHSLCT